MATEAPRETACSRISSPLNNAENTYSQPKKGNDTQDVLQRSQGRDHTVSHRHRLGLRHYPVDSPPLKARWFYAVDSPKWKPSFLDPKKENVKPLPAPKKFVPFTPKDSQSLEHSFQRLCKVEIELEKTHNDRPTDKSWDEPVNVPVNEDYLFDVNINRRELGPAYWVGPVYEVRRGTWFFQEGSTIKPCEENLATQLEEGYLKVKPWRSAEHSQHVTRPLTTANSLEQALLTSDDFMSRVSTTVYQTLGGVPGTRVVRGFSEPKKYNGTQDKNSGEIPSSKPWPDAPGAPTGNAATEGAPELSEPDMSPMELSQDTAQSETRPITTLERRVSSLAGAQGSVDLEEQARKQEEKEMEDLREGDDEDREREIDHLVLVTHGIGQRLGLRLESVNFIHDVNVLRKTMKRVYKASPDLQALNSSFPDKQKNCRVQVLPVCWRHLLEFPYKKVGQTRSELDLADADTLEDDVYPALSDITLESVPAVRNLISDLAIDVLLYQSKHREQISAIVKQECNRIIELYMKRNPSFNGSVSLCGHSLGSAILFDILCSRGMELKKTDDLDESSASASAFTFECEEFFCLGSPVALFEMLKGTGITINENQFAVSTPKCRQLYNIFHPSDPPQPLPSVKRSIWTASGQSLSLIGSRVGQSVGSLWTNFTSGVASSLLNRSLGIGPEDSSSQQCSGIRSQTRPRTSLRPDPPGNRSPTLIDPDIETLYEGFQKAKLKREKITTNSKAEHDPALQETDRGLRKLRLEEEKVRILNSNGRVDYSIQEGAFDISLIASLASHLSYWSDEDVNHFMLSQMLCRKRTQA
ncbi:hypothetical protein ASPSYDRAFT_57712 [Aspergillus sydowii CBS 593.65]|uniref:DDHD domain-containing protein n=1 Tax=Aspergillus sydowii CBS 593.65 TaxID=1036612 RepID=A0A1L9TG42_9EURO|nr:uncharacterized protein ASPSYDRAFT_57712 [Aspergillus sydowii CBS 593.65]OJJ58404.1 hypothetical protein ASPSYDRAFT_57712 [Aspergillus sydowii CBS 593.65]